MPYYDKFDKKTGGRPGQNRFDTRREEPRSFDREDRGSSNRAYKPSFNRDEQPARGYKPSFNRDEQPARGYKPSFSRDEQPARGYKPSFSRDEQPSRGYKPSFNRGDHPASDVRQDGFAPRRATPPRGPIPPARQVTPSPRFDKPSQPAFIPQEPEIPENLLVGRNPIREALRAGRPIEKMLVAEGELTGSAREIVAMAKEQRVIIQFVDRSRLDQVCKGHQGMLAYASAADYSTVSDILELADQRGEAPLVVILDGITDPHNLGAIIRSAECMGAHGVIVPERRCAGLGPAAVKASAGALSYIRVARVVNLSRTLDELKEAGLWITGTAMDAPNINTIDLSGPTALVIGSEGEGISHLIRQKCDQLAGLPMYGHIDSLNASVAAGIMLYEAAKSRHA